MEIKKIFWIIKVNRLQPVKHLYSQKKTWEMQFYQKKMLLNGVKVAADGLAEH